MVVLMLDRNASVTSTFSLVQTAAEQFVAKMLPADKARIGTFSYRIQVDPRTFTSDREELLRILLTNDLTTTFTRVADELHHQYAPGFTPDKSSTARPTSSRFA